MYLLFLYLGTIWLSSCRRYTEAGYLVHGGSSYHREDFSCNRDRKVDSEIFFFPVTKLNTFIETIIIKL